MIIESLLHYQLIVDIYCYHYYIFIVFNTTLVLVTLYKISTRYLNYRVVKNIVATTISFSLNAGGGGACFSIHVQDPARFAARRDAVTPSEYSSLCPGVQC